MKTLRSVLPIAAALALTLIIFALPPSAAPAQAQEASADTAAVLYRLAESYDAEGRSATAEYLLRLILQRYPDGEAASAARDLLVQIRGRVRGEGGRAELMAWHVIYGTTLGILIPTAVGAEGPELFGLGLLLGAPAGYYGPQLFYSARPVSAGQALAIDFGSYWGTIQGLAWRGVLDIGDGERCFPLTDGGTICVPEDSEDAPAAAAVIGGVAGMATGFLLGSSRPVETSTGLGLYFGSMWGSWYGLMTAVLLNVDEDEDGSATWSLLVGGNAGTLAAAFGMPKLNWSPGRTWTVHLSGLAGLVSGFGIDLLVDADDEELIVLIPGVTSLAGLLLGAATTSDDVEYRAFQEAEPQSALLEWRDGGPRLGIPMLTPALVPSAPDSEEPYELGLKVKLFSARF